MAITHSRPAATGETGAATFEPRRRRFTIDEYRRMGEVGILTEDERVELIEGEIVEMSPMRAPHIDCVASLTHVLVQTVGEAVRVHVQLPIRLPNETEPEPDLSLIRSGYDRRSVPAASDVVAVIEVADTSREYDRTFKLPLCAAAGIPEAWLFDLVADRIERYTEPGANGYQRIALADRGKSLTSTVLPAVVFSIDDVLGPEG
jgi:Uma2 family endonuclease